MKAFVLFFALVLTSVGCATSQRQSGNLAWVVAHQLRDYGATLPHLTFDQPSMGGIAQMYTSWRWQSDPGGFSLTFNDGKFDGVLFQMKQIAGTPRVTSDGQVHTWLIDQAAHVDLVRLPKGGVRMTCRRLAPPPSELVATGRSD